LAPALLDLVFGYLDRLGWWDFDNLSAALGPMAFQDILTVRAALELVDFYSGRLLRKPAMIVGSSSRLARLFLAGGTVRFDPTRRFRGRRWSRREIGRSKTSLSLGKLELCRGQALLEGLQLGEGLGEWSGLEAIGFAKLLEGRAQIGDGGSVGGLLLAQPEVLAA